MKLFDKVKNIFKKNKKNNVSSIDSNKYKHFSELQKYSDELSLMECYSESYTDSCTDSCTESYTESTDINEIDILELDLNNEDSSFNSCNIEN